MPKHTPGIQINARPVAVLSAPAITPQAASNACSASTIEIASKPVSTLSNARCWFLVTSLYSSSVISPAFSSINAAFAMSNEICCAAARDTSGHFSPTAALAALAAWPSTASQFTCVIESLLLRRRSSAFLQRQLIGEQYRKLRVQLIADSNQRRRAETALRLVYLAQIGYR